MHRQSILPSLAWRRAASRARPVYNCVDENRCRWAGCSYSTRRNVLAFVGRECSWCIENPLGRSSRHSVTSNSTEIRGAEMARSIVRGCGRLYGRRMERSYERLHRRRWRRPRRWIWPNDHHEKALRLNAWHDATVPRGSGSRVWRGGWLHKTAAVMASTVAFAAPLCLGWHRQAISTRQPKPEIIANRKLMRLRVAEDCNWFGQAYRPQSGWRQDTVKPTEASRVFAYVESENASASISIKMRPSDPTRL